jgi:hypothetical protein
MLGNGPVGVQNKNIDSFRLELEIPYSTEIVEDFSTYLLLIGGNELIVCVLRQEL